MKIEDGSVRPSIIKDCTGLNTILDPFQAQDTTFLAKAINVKITDSKAIEQVESPTHLIDLTLGHSIFCDGGACVVHDGGSLYEVSSALTLSAAKRTGMSGEPVDHTQFGEAIYFGNRSENGVYYRGSALTWSLDTYTGPTTSRQFASTVPLFDHIAMFNGIMLGAYDNHLFAAEPGKPGLWEMLPIWSTDTDITMIRPVVTDSLPISGGVYISDGKRITYLGGLNPAEFVETRVTTYPALEWSAACSLIDGALFGEKSGLCGVFGTTKGLCIGYPDGGLINVTQNKIRLPTGYTAGATLIKNHNIITTLR